MSDADASRRKFLKQAGAGVASATLLAGCTGDGDSNSDESTTATTNGSSGGQVQTGGEAVLGVEADVVELDPHKTSAYSSYQLLENIYEKLIYLDQNLKPQPMLAKDWSTANGGKEWTFQLQEGVQFHPPVSREFTAEDVVATIKRVKAKETGNPWRSSFTPITNVTADDDYTVTFTFDRPYAPFLVKLSRGYIMPKEVDQSGSYNPSKRPVGTGPFKFVEHQTKSHTQLQAFDKYWQTDDNGNQLPYLDSARYDVMPEGSARVTNLKTGEVDIVQSIPHSQANQVTNASDLTTKTVTGTSHEYVGYQTQKKPTSDVKFRQAMSLAISQQAVAKGVYFGYAVPTDSTIPPASPYKQYIDIKNPYGQDIKRAKQLVKESAYSGETLEIIAPTTYPALVGIAQIVQDSAEKIGVKTKINKLEWATMISRSNKGDFEIMPLGWSGLVEPDSWMYLLFHSNEAWNMTQYSNKEVDKLLEKARHEMDQAKRGEYYNKAANIIHDEAPYTNLVFVKEVMAWKNSVHDFIPYPNGVPRLNRVWIEQ